MRLPDVYGGELEADKRRLEAERERLLGEREEARRVRGKLETKASRLLDEWELQKRAWRLEGAQAQKQPKRSLTLSRVAIALLILTGLAAMHWFYRGA